MMRIISWSRASSQVQSLRIGMLALSLVGATWTTACKSYTEKTQEIRHEVARGNPAAALSKVEKLLEVRQPLDLPDDWGADTPLLVLERAALLSALGQYEASAKNYSAAESQLEYLDIARDAGGKIGSYIYSDSAKKYKSTPTEKLSLNALNMVNYLALGDLSGAKVEAKRFSIMRKYLQDYDPEHAHGTFGSLLAGFTFEKLGETNSALRYYDEVLEYTDVPFLAPVIARLAQHGTYRSERLEAYIEKGKNAIAPDDQTELLIVGKIGRVPFREARRIPVGLAIGLADTYFTGNTTVLQYGATKFVNYPELVAPERDLEKVELRIDGAPVPMPLVSDLAMAIIDEYSELKPRIVAAALTRMVARAAAAEGTRAGVNAASKSSGVAGAVAALVVEGALVAADKPDTRSWTLLPGRIFVARVPVSPGAHKVHIVTQGSAGTVQGDVDVTVKAGSFAVIDLTIYD